MCSSDLNVNNIGGPTLALVQLDDLICYGDANGAIDISVTGGAPPITYIWSTGATTEIGRASCRERV